MAGWLHEGREEWTRVLNLGFYVPNTQFGGPGFVHSQNPPLSQMWGCPFVITELKRWVQENCGFKARHIGQ